MRLTDMTVRTVPAPEQGQKTYFCDQVPGFGLRVSKSGTRSFVVIHGRSRQRTTIGKYGVIGLADARKRAREILAEHAPVNHVIGRAIYKRKK
jgi:Arm DNA-binding domain